MDNIIHDWPKRSHVPADIITVPGALRTAANLITDNGLAIGRYVDRQPGRKAAVCAVAAIRIAYGVDPADGTYDRTCKALPEFADWLACTQRVLGIRGEAIDVVSIWSDCVGDATEVAADLRQAADDIDGDQWRTSSHSRGGDCVQAAAIPGDCHGACTCCGGSGTMGGQPCGLCQGSGTCGSH